ncbi:hypothetical protein [Luteimonas sp. MC1825]|uniref:hypothetical protein n=1 Tax=Luteimonas sp. MC1825 TaxID=2761107 RepID=UPI002104331E|nr:hypothetical protein [Luteimonas sp. MC1825]
MTMRCTTGPTAVFDSAATNRPARAAIGEVQRAAQRACGPAAIVVPRDHVRGPVLAAPLPPGAIGPGDVEVGAVVLVQRLLHDVVDGERGLEAAQAQAPGRFRRTVFEVGLVDGRLAILEPLWARRVAPQPEFRVVLFAVQACGHATAGVPAAAELAAHAKAHPGADAVGVGGGAAAGARFGADVAEADVAAGLPRVAGLRAARGECQGERQGSASGVTRRGSPGEPALNRVHVVDLQAMRVPGQGGNRLRRIVEKYGYPPAAGP